MKILLSGSVLFLVIILSVGQAGFTSCTKEKTIIETIIKKDTVIIRDTVYIRDTAMSSQILTSHPWKTKELRAVYGDLAMYYLRGNSAVSNQNFDNESYVFYPDGTGLSIDANGFSHLIKEWKFVNAENTKLTFKYYITNSSIYHDMTWEHIRYKNKSILTDEYWHDNYINKNYHGQAIRIPQ